MVPTWLALTVGVVICLTWVAVLILSKIEGTGVEMPEELQYLGLAATIGLLAKLIGSNRPPKKGGEDE